MWHNGYMSKIRLIDIFTAFLYSGLILLGGGYIILPILQTELCDKRKWLTSEELTDYYAVSQSLPGLIAINMSVLVGYKLRGKSGAITGVIGVTFFAFWAIVLLASVISRFAENSYVQGAFWGIEIAVVILIISAVREMWSKAIKDKGGIIIFMVSLLVMCLTNISPACIIIGSVFTGILWKLIERRNEC